MIGQIYCFVRNQPADLSRHKRFSEGWTRFYTAELLLALEHLHSRGIIYRDLKPENILLDSQGHVKLGDFGLAKLNVRHACEGAKSRVGTPEYMAPEVIQKQSHGFTVDYWGLGMLVYEMMTGLPPWYTTDRPKLFRRLRSAPLDIPTYFSQSSASYVSALLERNPLIRPWRPPWRPTRLPPDHLFPNFQCLGQLSMKILDFRPLAGAPGVCTDIAYRIPGNTL